MKFWPLSVVLQKDNPKHTGSRKETYLDVRHINKSTIHKHRNMTTTPVKFADSPNSWGTNSCILDKPMSLLVERFAYA